MTGSRPDDETSANPTVVFLHALGSSGRAVDPVRALLPPGWRVVAPDLPGFGSTSSSHGLTVAESVAFVESSIREITGTRWLLVGHSMGGKITSLVAARTLAGTNGLFGLSGVMLLAASPPSPEPMDENRREEMIEWASGGALDARSAREFVDANVGSALAPESDRIAVLDVERTSAEAWTAWLQRGSREDWTTNVGSLDLPASILAGGADDDLGPDAQRRLNLPLYPRADVTVLDGAGHLLPLERPREVAAAAVALWANARRGPAVHRATAGLITSDHTAVRVRSTLARRSVSDPVDYEPRALSPAQLRTLRTVAEVIVPQGNEGIDLAVRLDAQLADGIGDGWRFADMPADTEAYRRALDSLADLVELDSADRHQRLEAVAGGTGRASDLTAQQLQHWFEDCCNDLIRLWLAHPATAARIRFDGFANGGNGWRQQGFQRLSIGERDGWEPEGLTT